jgi:TPR repeat protein
VDSAKAAELFERAKEGGICSALDSGADAALFSLGCEAEISKDDGQAERYLSIAAKSGHIDSLLSLGKLCERHSQFSRAVDFYNQAHLRGSVNGTFNLGVCYQRGLGVEQSLSTARALYLTAIEKGNSELSVRAMVNLANMADDAGSFEEAILWYQRGVEKGSPFAMYNLAVSYREGRGVAKDLEKSKSLLKKAAACGDSESMFFLGVIAEEDESDGAAAATWYEKAADGGHATAMCHLATILLEAHEYSLARQWFQRASDQGVAWAKFKLGYLLMEGWGCEKNVPAARNHFLEAAEQGCAEALNDLGFIAQESGNTKEAREWYAKAAELGLPLAQRNLALLASEAQDWKQAVHWLTLAAEQNDPDALSLLADCYWLGKGVAQDISKCINLFKQAAAHGNTQSVSCLASLYYHLGDLGDLNQARIWCTKAADELLDTAAMRYLAEMHLLGLGVVKSKERAEYWTNRAVLHEGLQEAMR